MRIAGKGCEGMERGKQGYGYGIYYYMSLIFIILLINSQCKQMERCNRKNAIVMKYLTPFSLWKTMKIDNPLLTLISFLTLHFLL